METDNASTSDDEIAATHANTTPSNRQTDQTEENRRRRRRYSVKELVVALSNARNTTGAPNSNHSKHTSAPPLSPELERRVLDFSLAQRKRHDKYGVQRPWGIFGMYAHLDNVRIDLEWAEDAAWRRNHGEPYLAWSDFDASLQKSSSRRPYWTWSVVAICTLMLLVEFAVNDWTMAPMNVNPMIGPSRETLVKVGARDTVKIVDEGQWFRLVTPLILHAGLIHYAINMLAFWFIGGAMEQSHGVVAAVVLFVVPGIGGNILSAIFLPQFVSVGASGGIFGLIGGCVADICLNWNLLFIRNGDETSDAQVYRRNFVAVLILVVEILINILCGLVAPVIDNWSHVGGFLYGAFCALSTIEPLAVGFFGVGSDGDDGNDAATAAAALWRKSKAIVWKYGGLMFTVLCILVSTVALATMPDPTTSPCHNCRYISCVPFPFFQDDKWWYCDDCDLAKGDLFRQQTVNGTDAVDGYYTLIDLTCPDESNVPVNIEADMLSDREVVRKRLPSYCREHCDSVFN